MANMLSLLATAKPRLSGSDANLRGAGGEQIMYRGLNTSWRDVGVCNAQCTFHSGVSSDNSRGGPPATASDQLGMYPA